MSMHRSIILLLAFLATGLNSAASLAHPVLTFNVATHVEADARSSTKESDQALRLIVTLGHRYLSVEDPNVRTIYDFDHKRIYSLNLTKHTYDETSLYTDIGFRVVEFQNRLGLAKAFRAGAAMENPVEPALMEQVFSLTDDQEHTVIDHATVGDETVFKWRDVTLLTVSGKSRDLPAAYQSEFWRFLRYYAGGHPRIYAALEDRNGVPEKLSILRPNVSRETRTFTLESVSAPSDTAYSLEGFQREAKDGEPYLTLMRLGPDAPAQLTVRATAAQRDRDAAAGAGKYFDALLSHFEGFFATGDSGVDWIAAVRDQLQTDAQARQLMGALNPVNVAAATQAVQTLVALRQAAPSHAAILEVFEANTRLGLGQSGQAEELFLSALHEDPYLVGPWNDLGGLYYGSFRPLEAWACWDAARALRPTHPMLQSIDKFEQKLRTDHPEFF
jgi:hypothetical protein